MPALHAVQTPLVQDSFVLQALPHFPQFFESL
jgi:hypothetical protein